MGKSLAEVNVEIGLDIQQMQKGLRSAERVLQRTGRQISNLGNNLSASFTLPIAAAGAAAFKFASDFEESFLKLDTLVGISGDQLKEFEEGITNLSPALGRSKTELSDALFVITSAGQRGSAALETLEQSSKAAAIGLGNTEDIARAAVSAVQAYGEANLSSAEAVDKLTAIVREGNLAAEELAPALGRVLPIAAQLGVSFDEVGANVAAFSRLGVSASESVTALRSLLSSILKPSAEAAKELARVGLSAQDLRDSIAENGLAATLQSLITAYDGNLEGLSKLIPNVEGLANALGTAGAQGEEYARIVDSIANSNGIVDAGFAKVSQTANFKLKQSLVSLQTAATELGSELVPLVTELLNGVAPLVTAFADLDDETKKIIISVGLGAAAIGPFLSLSGSLLQTYAGLSRAFKEVVGISKAAAQAFVQASTATDAGATSFQRLKTGVTAATQAFGKLDLATKATIIGVAVGAVIALALAFDDLSLGISSAAKAQATLNEVSLQAEKNIAAERIEAQQLTGILKDNTASLGERQAALARLNQIAPEYFGNLNTEKSSVEDITRAYEEYTAQLLQAARVQAAQEKIIELEKERLDILQRITDPGLLDQALDLAGGGTLDFALAGEAAKIQAQIDELSKVAFSAQANTERLQASANSAVAAPLSGGGGLNINTNAPTGGTQESGFKGFGEDFLFITDAARESSLAVESLNSVTSQWVASQTAAADAAAVLSEYTSDQTELLAEQRFELERLSAQYAIAQEAGEALGAAILQTSESGKASMADYAESIGNSLRNTISGLIAQGVTAAISNALVAGGPAGLFLAPAAGAAAAALFNEIVPKFADGGLVYGPTLGVFGEYPGASSNPEVVAPLNKLKTLIGESGGGRVEVYGRISGTDILLSSERSTARRARRMG